MKVLAIIPARGGSKGVPNKNIKLLGGKPLIQHTYESAIQSNLISKTIISTDDENIIKIAKEIGVEVPFIRPSELATDQAKSIDVVNHAVSFLEQNNEFYDAICLLQPTYPFREKDMIDKAIEKFKLTKLDALVSVLPVPLEYNPHWVFEPNKDNLLQIATGEQQIISRRQDLPKSYFRDGAIYLTKIDVIKKGTFYGNKLGYIESNPQLYVNIDTMNDWHKAEQIYMNF